MTTPRIVLLLCVAACGTPSSPRASEPPAAGVAARQTTPVPHAAPAASAPSTFHPDDDPACGELATLTSEVQLWRVAANPQPHRKRLAALWPTLPATCRGGTFYLVGAELIGRAADGKLATADGAVALHSSTEALARGLAVEPDHPRLLAHLAFADDLVPGQAPPLPAGACTRARERGGDAWTDDTAYVCALTAIHARDGAAATTELERIHAAGAFPDLPVRRAQALALSGKAKEAQALAKPAAAALASAPSRFDLTPAAIEALKKRLPAR